ncbi:MAG: hypothetical protein GX774_20980 [Armatimonadetes bacterium]|nr:hypothetical protein [Armatimonadota bacterium]
MNHPDELALQRNLQTLWGARRVILLAALLVGAAAFVFSRFVMDPVYEADSVLLVRSANASPLSSLANSMGMLLPGKLTDSISNPRDEVLAILKSRRIARAVVRQLGLQEAYKADSEAEAVTLLQEALRVQTGKENQIIIRAPGKSPRLAADIVNAFIRHLEEYQQTEESWSARRHLRFVEGRLLRAREDLRRAENALRAFQEGSGIVAADLSTAEVVKRTAEVETELANARVALGETKKRLEALRPRLVRRAGSAGAPPLANAGEVERLRGKLADLESELVVATGAYTEAHPQVRELRARIDEVKGQLREHQASAMKAAYEGIVPELIDLEVAAIAGQTRVEALGAELDRLRAFSGTLPRATLEYARLKREVEVQDQLYRTLSQRYHEARIAVEQSLLPVTVLDPAEPPERQSSPRVALITLLGLFFGLVGGALGVLLADWIRAVGSGGTPAERSGRMRDRVAEPERTLEPTARG